MTRRGAGGRQEHKTRSIRARGYPLALTVSVSPVALKVKPVAVNLKHIALKVKLDTIVSCHFCRDV